MPLGIVCRSKKLSSKGEVITLSQSDKKQPTKQLRGTARIVDGDTIWIGDTKIRLYGIDAPETEQECFREKRSKYHCGRVSTGALRLLVGLDPVRCKGYAYDRYDRLIATCYSGSINLNAELVRQGWALAYRRYSKDYIKLEKEA